jgi:HTH-type transcriptional regulator/antitoxin HipB
MSDLKKYIAKRKKTDKEFAEGFEEGYEQFKIVVVLRQEFISSK